MNRRRLLLAASVAALGCLGCTSELYQWLTFVLGG